MTTSAIPVNAGQRIDSDAGAVLDFRNVSISFPGNSVLGPAGATIVCGLGLKRRAHRSTKRSCL